MSAPSPDSPTVYERLGGEAGVSTAVTRFYERLLADPETAPFFEGIDLDSLRAHQRALIGSLLGGPEAYEGRTLAAAHGGLGISDADYDRVGAHLVAVLHELGADQDAVDTVTAALASVRADVVGDH